MPGQQQENAFISQSGFYNESLCSSVLSSTTAITDANGSLTQHVLYFAYGEQFVEEHRNSTNSPYLFNGKEYDEETGRYYYGARYYDPRISLWIGVDPLAGKYPGLSPYNFTLNNPMVLVDSDGRDVDPATEQNVAHLVNKESKTYNEEFAKLYDKLQNDHSTVYSFNEMEGPLKNDEGKKVYGNVTYNGVNENGQYKIGINYTKNTGTSGISQSSPLFEETFHAGQFSDGKFGYDAISGKAFALDVFDEAYAKLFAAQNTPSQKYGLEMDMLKAYNKYKDINDVVGFMKKRPSLSRYHTFLLQKEVNVFEVVNRSGVQQIDAFFDDNGKSKLPGAIMKRPR